MTITIETINGVEYTVVWHNDNYEYRGLDSAYYTRDDGTRVISNIGWLSYEDSLFAISSSSSIIATARPALPRYPKPEDAPLLYRYKAENIDPQFQKEINGRNITLGFLEYIEGRYHDGEGFEITHAKHNGKRVNIAIRENERLGQEIESEAP